MARPLPDPILFLDECLGRTDVADALREAGARVELLHEHFDAGTDDEEWLADVGARGWVVLTKDKRIRRRQGERHTLERAGVAVFALTAGTMSGSAMADAFVSALPRMRKVLRDREPPFIASVSASGRISLLTDAPRRAAKKSSPNR